MSTSHKDRLTWRKSSYSNANNGACVEVAYPDTAVAVRDSKNRAGGKIVLPQDVWKVFLRTQRRR